MSRLNSIIGFIPTRNDAASRAFYEGVLGLRFVADDGFAMVFESGGNMLRVVRVGEYTPPPFTVLGWESTDIEQDVAEFAARGIAFERYSFVKQDQAGIWTTPSGDKVAWFKDPDGNTLSLSQHARRTVLSD
jgi:catechol 2,3-dioxygenase-like lactoylglutathione lyase family enzyme